MGEQMAEICTKIWNFGNSPTSVIDTKVRWDKFDDAGEADNSLYEAYPPQSAGQTHRALRTM